MIINKYLLHICYTIDRVDPQKSSWPIPTVCARVCWSSFLRANLSNTVEYSTV